VRWAGSLRQAIGRDGVIVIAVGGLDAIATLLASAQARLLHEPGDAVASVVESFFAQRLDHARAAISLAAPGMEGIDRLGQRLVFHRARAGVGASIEPVVVAAGRDFQIAAKRQD